MAEPNLGVPSPTAIQAWSAWASESRDTPDVLNGRFPIFDVEPKVESGRRPAKAAVNELIGVAATVFREGHDLIGVEVASQRPDGSEAERHPLVCVNDGTARWEGSFRPDTEGDWTFTIEAWADPVSTWIHRAEIKIPADVDAELEIEEGILTLNRAADQMTKAANRAAIAASIHELSDTSQDPNARFSRAITEGLLAATADEPLRDLTTICGPWPLQVDRRLALVGSWYELFPRSENAGAGPDVHGTFATAAQRLDAVAEMGFDVVYMPPIHPIGEINRKGRNNSVDAAPGDVGSPWAIGSKDGGHDTVHPQLGTLDDFDAFLAKANSLDLEVALDLALQVAPDHPWATEGKPWFVVRADGTIAYAENPPKKYQDIYPMWFDGDPDGLVEEVLRIIHFWAERGVRIFRVDNPHTKPVRFWDRVLNEVRRTDPDILFLAEAFTRPPMMRALAEVGFHQSYSYFTWRNEKEEIEKYFTELSERSVAYMRPNLFVNTPDILTAYLQYGGPAAFAIRATLAATLGPTWGVYAGFELFEHVAVKPGSEEYLDSEKYQLRPRDWQAAQNSHSLIPYVTMLNELRRKHPALQTLRGITFHEVDNSRIIAYSRQDQGDTVIVVCSLDPFSTQEATIHLDLEALGFEDDQTLTVTDEVSKQTWQWNAHPYVRIDPIVHCAHICHVHSQGSS